MPGELLTLPDGVITSRKVDLTQDSQEVATAQTTTSGSFVDLATVGPSVTLTPGITQDHIVWFSSHVRNSSANTESHPGISLNGGAVNNNTRATAATAASANVTAGRGVLAAAQPSGAVHKMMYATVGGTATFSVRLHVGMCI